MLETERVGPTLHPEWVVRSSRGQQIRPDRDRRFVRLRHGFALDSHPVPEGLSSWDLARLVTQARSLACLQNRAGQGGIRLAGECVLVSEGLPTWLCAPDIQFTRSGPPVNPVRLPAVTVGEHTVPSVVERSLPIGSQQTRSGDHLAMLNGKASERRESQLGRVAADLALAEHPLVAVVGISNLLSNAFQNPTLGITRELAVDEVLNVASTELRARSSRRRIRLAQASLDAARPGIESPGEGFLLWALAVVLRENDFSEATTQFRVRAPEEQANGDWLRRTGARRIDVALPRHKVALEFDGTGKLRQEFAQQDFLDRQRALRSLGWEPLHIDWRMVLEPERTLRYLRNQLESAGVPVRGAPGPLWRPLPTELTDPARLWGFS